MSRPTFALFGRSLESFEGAVGLSNVDVVAPERPLDRDTTVRFDPDRGVFLAQESKAAPESFADTGERVATHREALVYVDALASQHLSMEGLRLRVHERALGFVPSFQYQVESFYLQVRAPARQILESEPAFKDTQSRKKAVESVVREQVVPGLKPLGFERRTRRSRQFIKHLDDGLVVCVFMNSIRFGAGYLEANVVYFDEGWGSIDEDAYLASLTPNFPYSTNLAIETRNPSVLKHDTNEWLRVMELYIVPFIERHRNHRQLVAALEAEEDVKEIRAAYGIEPRARGPAFFLRFPSPARRPEIVSYLRSTMG